MEMKKKAEVIAKLHTTQYLNQQAVLMEVIIRQENIFKSSELRSGLRRL